MRLSREDMSDLWLEQCEHSGIAEFVRFAQGLRRDDAAVHAALRYPWSHDYVAYCTSSLGR